MTKKEIEELKKYQDSLQDKAADLFEDKSRANYKYINSNHKKLEQLKKLLRESEENA